MSTVDAITPEILLSRIEETGYEAVCLEFRQAVLSSTMLAVFYDQFGGSNKDAVLFLTEFPHTPSRVLVQIANDWSDEDVLVGLANHQRTMPDVLQELAETGTLLVRKAIAANRSITPQTAQVLAVDESMIVRTILAENPIQFPSVQLQQLKDESPCVRTSLAANRKSGTTIWSRMLTTENPFEALTLGAVVDLADDTLLELADLNQREAQHGILLSDSLSDEVLESLSFSYHSEVALEAIRRKHLSNDELIGWARHDDPEFRALIAGMRALPEVVQLVLAKDESRDVLQVLAENRSLTDATAFLMTECCKDDEVLTILAGSPAVSPVFIEAMCQKNDVELLQVLALRPDLTDLQTEQLLQSECAEQIAYIFESRGVRCSSLTRDFTRRLVASDIPTLRKFAARSNELDVRDIPRLVYDPCRDVRLIVIDNESITAPSLEFLANDKDYEVAEKARCRLEELSVVEEDDRPNVKENVSTGLLSRFINKIKGS